MPFKYDAQGNIVTADHNGKKLPVFVNAKGEEAPFDGDGTVETISRLNGEARTHREAKEALEKITKGLPEALLKDPAAALKALETVANLDAKKLVDAGEIERVKGEIAKSYQAQLDELKKSNEGLNGTIYELQVGGAFASSKFIAEKCAIPADFVQARFGNNFGIDNGKVYAVDAAGNKLYSRTNPGELAGFDEAISMLIDAYPQKDAILKGTGASGGGAQNNGGAGGGSGGKGAGNFGGNRQERAAAIAAKFPELAQQGGQA